MEQVLTDREKLKATAIDVMTLLGIGAVTQQTALLMLDRRMRTYTDKQVHEVLQVIHERTS
jgi:hypothetical protein